jgi:FKBP-type peptidyl-prolyl cis-trans isomerase SlyD
MRVTKDRVVTIEYSARLDGGEVVDTTEGCGPVSYLQGNEQIFPALEEAVDRLARVTERLSLAPSQGYASIDQNPVRRMPRA